MFVVGGGIIGGSFLLAKATVERWRRVWPALLMFLVMPFGVSALLAGAAFRMLFDPAPERGTMTRLADLFGLTPNWLGTFWVWVILTSAFAWLWLGFAVSLFRAALDAIERDPVEKAKVKRAGGRLGRLKAQWATVRPVRFIVTMTIVVAAARVFDLVLIAVPGSVQYDYEMVGVQWWRLTTVRPDRGGPAAFVLPMAIILTVFAVAIAGQVKTTVPPTPMRSNVPASAVTPETRPRRGLGAILLSALLALPLVVVVATAFHGVQDAGAVPWWQIPFGSDVILESFQQAATAGLWRSVGVTALVATTATLVVVGAAVPVAYFLVDPPGSARASEDSWLRKWRNHVVVLLTVLAVMPVPMYALAVRDATATLGISGSRIPLIFVHAAAGLPFAILVLRAAIAAAPQIRAEDAIAGLIDPREAARRMWNQAGKAVVAVAVLEFVLVWNDFIISFLVGGHGTSPLTQVLWGEARQFSVASGTVAASAVVSAVAPIIVLLATWKRFVVPGLTGGVLR